MMAAEEKYKVIPTEKFIKEFAKLSDEDKKRVLETIGIMRATPFYPKKSNNKNNKEGTPPLRGVPYPTF